MITVQIILTLCLILIKWRIVSELPWVFVLFPLWALPIATFLIGNAVILG